MGVIDKTEYESVSDIESFSKQEIEGDITRDGKSAWICPKCGKENIKGVVRCVICLEPIPGNH